MFVEAREVFGVLRQQLFMHAFQLLDGLIDFAEIRLIGVLYFVPPRELLVGRVPLTAELLAPLLQALQCLADGSFSLE
ncbi:hypothetical protein D3C85_1841280 [compost metagenome]